MYDDGVYCVENHNGVLYGSYKLKIVSPENGDQIHIRTMDHNYHHIKVFRCGEKIASMKILKVNINNMSLKKVEFDITTLFRLHEAAKTEINCSYWNNRWWK